MGDLSLVHLLHMVESGIHRLNLLVMNNAVYVVFRHGKDRPAAGEDTNQVGDGHESVKGVRQVPCQLQFHC